MLLEGDSSAGVDAWSSRRWPLRSVCAFCGVVGLAFHNTGCNEEAADDEANDEDAPHDYALVMIGRD